MQVERGARGKLEKFFDVNSALTVNMKITGNAVYDFSCFGVDGNNKLSDDRYMIFYNQPKSPNNEITYSEISNGVTFSVNLNKLPSTIQKLVFTASIDGVGKMGEISAHSFSIEQTGRESVTAEFSGKDFHEEKAVTTVEIYRKDGWRFNVIARGFNGGLDALLKFYGGELVEDIPPAVQKVSLEKKISDQAPELIYLVKPLKVELEKRNLLDTVAKVALVMDISGSMTRSYKNGTVQEIVNKILPVAVQFDDDGELDFWYFGKRAERMPSANTGNYKNAVGDWRTRMTLLGAANYEPAVIREVIDEYRNSDIPAYVIFISDGGIYHKKEITQLLIESSRLPIFWQFVGVSGKNYGILENLDTMSGRYIDNANFFALDDFRRLEISELYSRLLNEFPGWLKAAKRAGIIR